MRKETKQNVIRFTFSYENRNEIAYITEVRTLMASMPTNNKITVKPKTKRKWSLNFIYLRV